MKHKFCYISKKDPKVKTAYNDILAILKATQNILKPKFTFRFDMIGSYKRNMITYDRKSNKGFDFDFDIEVNDDNNTYTAKEIKNMLQNTIGAVCVKYGYKHPEDSTRVLTIKMIENSRIIHSCDFAIVKNYIDEDGYERQQYIHFNKKTGSYSWCEQPNGYYMLPEKVEWIKEQGLWTDTRNLYCDKKNKNNDSHVHSRSIFAMTVHEICQKSGFFDNEN